ncbi:hypothetical protein [Roseomonas sp. BN140053]|uniref:hypothetical protein n=1 Tax=Roseomonas sp. BN140053 TaxID=3391898 RepID=UPI0039E9C255
MSGAALGERPAAALRPALPTYRLDRSFEWNAENGPRFEGPFPPVPDTPEKRFLGLPVRSRFGLAASLGLRAPWVELYARLGFDILTYKTVRLRPKLAAPMPNWLFVPDDARAADPEAPLRAEAAIPADPAAATAVGSIAMPSSDPAVWRPDIARCRALLRPGQVLVVSVVGTAREGMGEDAFVAEFEELAAAVREAGAQAVEANLSCPNVGRGEGETYLNAPLAGRIARAVRRGAGGLPVLLKIGAGADDAALAALLRAVAGSADAVTAVNAPSRVILDASGAPAFGTGRERAGLMGGAVHGIALDCVRRAVDIVRRDRLGLEIVAVGGVTSPARARAMLEAGACAALAASGAAWNPYLAMEVKRADPAL